MEKLVRYIEKRDTKGVQLFCSNPPPGVNLNKYKDAIWNTRNGFISFAVRKNCSIDLLKVLLDVGFNPNIPENDNSPLNIAIDNGREGLAILLMKHGVIVQFDLLEKMCKANMTDAIELIKNEEKLDCILESIETGSTGTTKMILKHWSTIRVPIPQEVIRHRKNPSRAFIEKYFGVCLCRLCSDCPHPLPNCTKNFQESSDVDNAGAIEILALISSVFSRKSILVLNDIIHYAIGNERKTVDLFKGFFKHVENTDSSFDINNLYDCLDCPECSPGKDHLLSCAMYQRQEEIVRFLCCEGANVNLVDLSSLVRLDHFYNREGFVQFLLACGLKFPEKRVNRQPSGWTFLYSSRYKNLPFNYDTRGVNFNRREFTQIPLALIDNHMEARIRRVITLFNNILPRVRVQVPSLQSLARQSVVINIGTKMIKSDKSLPTIVMRLIRDTVA